MPEINQNKTIKEITTKNLFDVKALVNDPLLTKPTTPVPYVAYKIYTTTVRLDLDKQIVSHVTNQPMNLSSLSINFAGNSNQAYKPEITGFALPVTAKDGNLQKIDYYGIKNESTFNAVTNRNCVLVLSALANNYIDGNTDLYHSLQFTLNATDDKKNIVTCAKSGTFWSLRFGYALDDTNFVVNKKALMPWILFRSTVANNYISPCFTDYAKIAKLATSAAFYNKDKPQSVRNNNIDLEAMSNALTKTASTKAEKKATLDDAKAYLKQFSQSMHMSPKYKALTDELAQVNRWSASLMKDDLSLNILLNDIKTIESLSGYNADGAYGTFAVKLQSTKTLPNILDLNTLRKQISDEMYAVPNTERTVMQADNDNDVDRYLHKLKYLAALYFFDSLVAGVIPELNRGLEEGKSFTGSKCILTDDEVKKAAQSHILSNLVLYNALQRTIVAKLNKFHQTNFTSLDDFKQIVRDSAEVCPVKIAVVPHTWSVGANHGVTAELIVLDGYTQTKASRWLMVDLRDKDKNYVQKTDALGNPLVYSVDGHNYPIHKKINVKNALITVMNYASRFGYNDKIFGDDTIFLPYFEPLYIAQGNKVLGSVNAAHVSPDTVAPTELNDNDLGDAFDNDTAFDDVQTVPVSKAQEADIMDDEVFNQQPVVETTQLEQPVAINTADNTQAISDDDLPDWMRA